MVVKKKLKYLVHARYISYNVLRTEMFFLRLLLFSTKHINNMKHACKRRSLKINLHPLLHKIFKNNLFKGAFIMK